MVVVSAGLCVFMVSWRVGDVIGAYFILQNALDSKSNQRSEREVEGGSDEEPVYAHDLELLTRLALAVSKRESTAAEKEEEEGQRLRDRVDNAIAEMWSRLPPAVDEAVIGDDEPREASNQDFTSTTGGLGVASSLACAGVGSGLHLFGGVFVGKAAEAYWTAILQLRRGDGSCFEDSQTGATRGDARRADGAIRGLKRRRAGAVAPSDATPRAPEGRAAAQAKAAGQGCTTFVSECSLPTEKGYFRLRAYRYADGVKTHEPVVMVAGNVRGRENVPVRVHDQCQTSEVLGSKRCDCREQLDLSLRYIQEHGGGAVIYLAQEGRGIGLANKVAAYALQDDGLDTVEANRQLGFGDDERSYECVGFILGDMEIKSVQLMTNNPFKIDWLRATGVKVKGRIPIEVPPNEHNHGYLEAKASRMSHLINSL